LDSKIEHAPLIIGFVSNLLFTSKLEDAAHRADLDILWIGSWQELNSDELIDVLPKTDLQAGSWNVLLERVTRIRPALILFDLGNPDIPWRNWLPLLKSSPSTRRLPIICFGSHVDKTQIAEAKDRGADAFFARSRMLSDAQKIFKRYADIIDTQAINRSCQQPISSLAIKGLEYFNQREYFAAHEELEFAWKADPSVGRVLYQAVLQIGVAYLQIQRKNYWGAYKMFLRVRQWIDPLPESCRGINIGKLRKDAELVYQELLELGPERLDEFDFSLLKPVEFRIDNIIE
jgi:predicted metal-dependent hydrolase